MACYHPILAYRGRVPGESGKRPLVFKASEGLADMPLQIPCGRCWGCRLERSRQWAMRCMLEASMHDYNCFITLTYNDKHCPGSLNKRDFQLFMKRLRKHYGERKIRYYQCGEYGDLLKRPHYHACLFGVDFLDKKLWIVRDGVKLYRSAILEKLWSIDEESLGFSTIGEVTFESAAYVARYIMKKQLGKNQEEYYKDLLPPYTTMSRKPGLARKWYDLYKTDVYPDDFIVLRGNMKLKPPKYFDAIYDLTSPEKFAHTKRVRKERALVRDEGLERLAVKEECKLHKIKQLRRSYENNG